MRTLALILNAFVVGLGHLLMDRHLAALLHFTVFAVAANGLVIGLRLWQGPEAAPLVWCAGAALALIWLYSMGTLLHAAFFFDTNRRRREIEELFLAAVKAYGNGAYMEAREDLRAVLALDRKTVPARLLVARTYLAEGNGSRAAQAVRDCRRLDRQGCWQLELDELTRLLEQEQQGRAAARRRVKAAEVPA